MKPEIRAMFQFAEKGDVSRLRVCLWNDKHLNTLDTQGNSLLHAACKGASQGNVATAIELIETGFNPHLRNEDGDQPVHLAAAAGSLANIRLLLKEGVLPTVPDGRGRTPLHLLSLYSHDRAAIDFLMDAPYPEALLNRRNDKGQTPLHLAVERSHVLSMRMLAMGADPRIPDQNGVSPLDLVKNGRNEKLKKACTAFASMLDREQKEAQQNHVQQQAQKQEDEKLLELATKAREFLSQSFQMTPLQSP